MARVTSKRRFNINWPIWVWGAVGVAAFALLVTDLAENEMAQFVIDVDLSWLWPDTATFSRIRATGETLAEKQFKADLTCKLRNPGPVRAAYIRASSAICRHTIVETACRAEARKLYPQGDIKRACPSAEKKLQLVGCFELPECLPSHSTDGVADVRCPSRPRLWSLNFRKNSPEKCTTYCFMQGHRHAGVTNGTGCHCLMSVSPNSLKTSAACHAVCSGAPHQRCGGPAAMHVYTTGVGKMASHPITYPLLGAPTDDSDLSIVFIIHASGRDARQVKRLIGALYRMKHFFYIHVDKRSEYLYSRLSSMASLDNVFVTPIRHVVLEGGAGHVRVFQQVLRFMARKKKAKWHYLLTLDQGHYPIKPIGDLERFLDVHRGLNFIGLTNSDATSPLFSRTYVECDGHVWQLGRRRVPRGVVLYQGYASLTLSRQTCRHLSNSADPLNRAMATYSNYSLSPAESWLVTQVINSHYCGHVVGHSLTAMNDGPAVQRACVKEAAEVDAGMCSLPVFTKKEQPKLKKLNEEPRFLAHRFDPMIDLDILNVMDNKVFGGYSKADSLKNHWVSVYDRKHSTPRMCWKHTLLYHVVSPGIMNTLSEKSKGNHNFETKGLHEIFAFRQGNLTESLILNHKAFDTVTKKSVEVQTKVDLTNHAKKFTLFENVAPFDRLVSVEVNDNLDYKDLIYRNYGRLLDQQSSPGFKLHYNGGDHFMADIIFIDPAKYVIGRVSFNFTDSKDSQTDVYRESLDHLQPWTPGEWTLDFVKDDKLFARMSYLVLPSPATFVGNGVYSSSREDMKNKKKRKRDRISAGEEEIARQGIQQFYQVDETCVVSSSKRRILGLKLPSCSKCSWSTVFPDQKSEVGVRKRGKKIIYVGT